MGEQCRLLALSVAQYSAAICLQLGVKQKSRGECLSVAIDPSRTSSVHRSSRDAGIGECIWVKLRAIISEQSFSVQPLARDQDVAGGVRFGDELAAGDTASGVNEFP
jgi:hypothetical protein